MRERRHRLRGCLSDRVGRRVAHHDFIPAVHDRQIHGTPRISEPRVQARNARYEKRPFGVQSGWYSLTRLTSIFISGNIFFFRSLVRHPYIFFNIIRDNLHFTRHSVITVDAGHTSGHQRHTLGLRTEPFFGQKRVGHHDPAAGEERAVRHRAVRHPAQVFDDAARHDLCPHVASARYK